jgi:hypothetical protein
LYLDFGHTIDQVISGEAYEKSYQRTHYIAEKLELQLIQRVGKMVLGRDLPLYVIYPTRPCIQLFNTFECVLFYNLVGYLPNNSLKNLYNGTEKFIPFEFNPQDAKDSFALFEQFGTNNYTTEFKDECHGILKRFVEKANKKYAKPKIVGMSVDPKTGKREVTYHY